MKEGTKNTLKFLLAMLILFWCVDFVVMENPVERKESLVVLLFIVGIVSVFLLLRKYYTVKMRKQQRQALQDDKRQQDLQKRGPAETGSWDRNRRLEQLDSFLQNGIIDKKEYAALKKKYQGYE